MSKRQRHITHSRKGNGQGVLTLDDREPTPSSIEGFFAYINKRERVRQRKESGELPPWCGDPVLCDYKFCNVKRSDDRTTRRFKADLYDPNSDCAPGLIVFNAALLRYTGTTQFAEAIGWQWSWRPERIIAVAERRMRTGQVVFTDAYRCRPDNTRSGVPTIVTVVEKYLDPLWRAKDEIAVIACRTKSWRRTHERLQQVPGFGGAFMAMQVCLDLALTPVLRGAHDRNSWCPAGPGALRGLNRIHGRATDAPLSQDRALDEMLDLFDERTDYLEVHVPELELPDIQFNLCEYDKYERIRLDGKSGRRYYPFNSTHPNGGRPSRSRSRNGNGARSSGGFF
jgi:hypothetical protein